MIDHGKSLPPQILLNRNDGETNGTVANLPPHLLLSRDEVEAHFGITRRFLELAAIRGDGPPMVKLGRSVRYKIADLKGWIDARRVTSTSQELPR